MHMKKGYTTVCGVDYETDVYETTDEVDAVSCQDCNEEMFRVLLTKVRRRRVLDLVEPKVS